MQRLQSLLKQVEDDRPITVHIFSDLQRSECKAGSKTESVLSRQLNELKKRAQVRVIDVGANDLENIALTKISLDAKRPSLGEECLVRADLENFSATASSVSVDLKLNGISLQTQSLIVPERTTKAVQFPIMFTKPGSHILEVSSSTDALVDDNRRWQVVDVVDEFKVLIIQQPSSSEVGLLNRKSSKYRAADYLQLAFTERIDSTVINLATLTQQSLADYDVIIATDIPSFTNAEASLLKEFVQSGGGLTFILGEAVKALNYNTQLGVGEQGLLPATILDEIRTAEESPFLFVPTDRNHPLLEQFQDHPEAGLETTRVYRYHQVEIRSNSQAQTEQIIDSPDGSPLLLSKSLQKGR